MYRSTTLSRFARFLSVALVASLCAVVAPVQTRTAQASAVGTIDTFATFSGSNYFTAADNDAFDVTGNLTVSAWLRPTSLCATSECVFLTKEANYLFGIKNGTYQYAIRDSGGGWDWRPTGVIPILNQWQNVSFAVARSSSTLTMYLNGRQVHQIVSATNVPTSGFNSSNDFTIGARYNGTQSKFFGSIDEVRVYNTTRASESQAQADMNTWGPVDATGLVLYYDFNEGSGSVLTNRVTGAASATNLAATGSPTWTDVKRTATNGNRQLVAFSRSYLTSVGGYTIPDRVTSLDYLVVAGGGGGGTRHAGGGGAGGFHRRTEPNLMIFTTYCEEHP